MSEYSLNVDTVGYPLTVVDGTILTLSLDTVQYPLTVVDGNQLTLSLNGATGPAGINGAAGPNQVTTSTTTLLVGYIYGNGTTIAGATAASENADADTLALRSAGGELKGSILYCTGSGASYNGVLQLYDSITNDYAAIVSEDNLTGIYPADPNHGAIQFAHSPNPFSASLAFQNSTTESYYFPADGGTLLANTGNLAGLSNLSTSLTNLGLGTGDSPTFAGVNIATTQYQFIKNVAYGANAITTVIAGTQELAVAQNGIYVKSFGIGNTVATPDIFLTRKAAASLRLGAADAAASSAIVTGDITTNLVTWASHGLTTGCAVSFSNVGGTLFGGIAANTLYYVVVISTNTFKLAATYAAAIAATPTTIDLITTNGTPTTTAKAATTYQSLNVQNYTGTNVVGSPMVINGSQGTGLGAGGPIVFRTSPASGSSSATQNTLTNSVTIDADGSIALRNSATNGVKFSTQGNLLTIRYAGGGSNINIDANNRSIYSNDTIGIGGGFGVSIDSNTIIRGEAGNILAQRNGTSAQTSRIYDTYTSSTDYHRLAISTARATATMTGASVTLTGLIPAGAVVVGVTTKVTTAITGATSFSIGTTVAPTRFGTTLPLIIGSTSDNKNWTSGTIECFPTATDIVLTAIGSNFTAGVVYVSVQYMTGQAD